MVTFQFLSLGCKIFMSSPENSPESISRIYRGQDSSRANSKESWVCALIHCRLEKTQRNCFLTQVHYLLANRNELDAWQRASILTRAQNQFSDQRKDRLQMAKQEFRALWFRCQSAMGCGQKSRETLPSPLSHRWKWTCLRTKTHTQPSSHSCAHLWQRESLKQPPSGTGWSCCGALENETGRGAFPEEAAGCLQGRRSAGL